MLIPTSICFSCGIFPFKASSSAFIFRAFCSLPAPSAEAFSFHRTMCFIIRALRSSDDGDELYFEGEVPAREGMVRIQRDARLGHAGYRDQDDLVVLLGELEPLSHLGIHALGKIFPVHLHDAFRAVLAVG